MNEQALAEALRAAADTLDPRIGGCGPMRFEPDWKPGEHIGDALEEWASKRIQGTGRTLLEKAAEQIRRLRYQQEPIVRALNDARRDASTLQTRTTRAIALLQDVTEPECYSHTRPINHIRQALMILRGEAG
jgi:GNAT superfamily N-acetyltransferase